jgi:OOP family OmpA-OmpF porin
MAILRAIAAVAILAAAIGAQPQTPGFPLPAGHPETVGGAQDFPYLPPLPGGRLIETQYVDGPLELKPATADDEAVLAGRSYARKIYDRSTYISAIGFVASYRDALFASGWKLVDVTKLDAVQTLPETVTVAAHYMSNGRNIYARLSQGPDGPYQISVADVGAEDWAAALARECRVRIPSIHFDLDRPSIRTFESEPTLDKLADVLKSRTAPAVEIESHMDNIGEAGTAARQALSEGRAKAVAAWLTAHGVPANKVTAKGYGKQRPIAENDSDLGRALNRRIEVAALKCRAPVAY